ncbi:MAG: efflux RND transporter periplasmic adaptor subunit [Holophaga sp.]|jgi:RND family efflux transporter MFP subunit
MTRRNLIVCTALAAVLLVGAIGMHRYRRGQELAHQRALKQAGLVPVTLATVENHPFQGTIPFTGTLLAVNRAELKAEEPGRVTRVTVQEGDRVPAGAVLCAQEEEDLFLAVQGAEAQLAQARVQADQAGHDNDRAQALLQKRSVTRQAAQQAETAFAAAQAAMRAAESSLGLARSHLRKSCITAPFAGEVATRLVQPGEVLAPGSPAFTLVDNRRLEIQADLPAAVLARIHPGMPATFRVAGFDRPFQATLTQISASVQQDGRTLRVRLVAPNPEGRLKSGLFAEGEILAAGETTQAALPSAILTAVGREADVYLAVEGVARRRRILVGPEQGGWRPVEGIAPGAQVVAQGRDLVVDGTRLQSADPVPPIAEN